MSYLLKILLSAALLVGVSELGKKSSFLGAVLGSLPIVSIFAFIWIFIETQDTEKITHLSASIFWLVIPSLILFVALPVLLRHQINFWLSLLIACSLTFLGYWILIKVLRFWNIEL